MALRVATLNIWNRMGPWESRLTAIRHQLEALSPDIIGLQEVLQIATHDVDFDQAAMIAKDFGYHVVFGRHPESTQPMGNAILSRWPIVRTEVRGLPSGDSDEYRSVVFAEVDAPCGRVPFFCTHLNWKLDEGHIRELQVRFVADTIASVAPRGVGFPAVLVGDLNAEPDSDEIRFLRGLHTIGGSRVYFADCFGLVGRGDGTTFSRANPHAAILREPNRRIDYVFVRGPDDHGRGDPLDARVVFDAPVEGSFPSDHFGVSASLRT